MSKAQAKQVLFGGRVVFEMWGKNPDEPINMSLSRLQEPAYQEILAGILEERGIRVLYAPNPAFNAVTCTPADLTEVTELPGGAKVYRGCKADGIIFGGKGSAGCFTPADCATGVFGFGSEIALLHCGTKCLVDTDARGKGEKTARPFESVVNSALARNYGDMKAVEAFIGGSIHARNLEHPFDHEMFGESNRRWVESVRAQWPNASTVGNLNAAAERGNICLVSLFAAQALQQGVSIEKITRDEIDTFQQRWFSNRRGDKTERNFVLVYPTE